MIDEALKQYATTRQAEYIDAVNLYGGYRQASEKLGVHHTVILSAIKAVNKKFNLANQPKPQDNPKRKHFVIPDVQAKEGNDFSYLRATGNYIVEKKPDVIVCIGDFADMESLSGYDVGTKSFEGRSYQKDIWAAREAMDALLIPLFDYNKKAVKEGLLEYKPRMVLTLGNHCDRITRAVNNDRKLDGLISIEDLPYQDWEVIPFLEVVVIDGIAYSHFFTSGVMGRPVTSAQALLNKMHMSCVAGHQQGRQIAFGKRADGKEITAIISGSYYEHDEPYLGAQGNKHWRGCWLLHNVDDGSFDECAVPLHYIKDKYL